MPRGRGLKDASVKQRIPRRSGRGKQPEQDVVPAVYREMLAEVAGSSAMKSDGEGRTVKRRRVGERVARPKERDEQPAIRSSPEDQMDTDDGLNELFGESADEKPQQMVFDDFGETDDDDDEDFEDVNIENVAPPEKPAPTENLNISLQPIKAEKATSTPRRKPVSAAERRLRLDVHKLHVLCLLAHVRCRSDWCNDTVIQAALKPLLPRKVINLLHIDEDQPQYQRNHSWNKGVEECCRIWKEHFEITTRGLRRSWWTEDAEKGLDFNDLDAADNLSDKDDFKQAARTQAGSRDVGAQLFCALLRSVAIDTRLVCSLQPLPFSGVAKGVTPEKPKPDYILATDIHREKPEEDGHTTDSSADFSNPRRRIGQPQFSAPTTSSPRRSPAPKKKKIVDSPYPVFWVEAFNEASQKWIPLDPIVRHTINKPKTGFEPPASDRLNNMSYVIAFEEDGTARDVTLRYTRHYNAKTRKTRVESTKGGEAWWKKTMSFFEKSLNEDRDEIEDAELAAREAAEEMPRNVQDFKDHPHYALERHLRRNQAIWPMKEVGKVSPGMGKDAKLESIYRRRDVHIVRSADQWYRLGRDVKFGEQPLKRAVPKRKQTQIFDEMDEDDEDTQEGTRLYAEFQTNIYIPPPVVKGRVPRNAYGNIDVYTSTMIPPGSIHIQHPESARAAKTLGVNIAAAVTGFEFKGRQGTAVVKGIVVAAEYREALVEVLRCFNDEQARAMERARTLEALKTWKKFLVGLRIKERIKEYEEQELEDETSSKMERKGRHGEDDEDDDSEDGDYIEERDGGGGFFTEDDNNDDDTGGGGFIPDPTSSTIADNAEEPPPFAREDTFSARADRLLSNIDLDAGIIIQESPHPLNPNPIPTKKIGQLAAAHEDMEVAEPESPLAAAQTQTSRSPNTKPNPNDTPRQQYNLLIMHPKGATEQTRAESKEPVGAIDSFLPAALGGGDLILATAPESRAADEKNEDEEDGEMEGGFLRTTKDDEDADDVEDEEGEENVAAADSEIEKGSLLSEDPEDRDADPEWLD